MFDLSRQILLVVAPHPDDEVIGCGGLIKKIKDAGGKVYVLYLTVGDTKDFSKKGLSTSRERQKEIAAVAKFLKFDRFHLAFPGNKYHLRLDTLGQKTLMDTIERESPVAIEKTRPTIVAFPSPASYNQDHRIVAEAVHAATRPADKKSKHFVPVVLAYEELADVWSLRKKSEPNLIVALTEAELTAKIEAMKLYKSQVRAFPNLRSLERLRSAAVARGAEIGERQAEGFFQYRGVLG